MVGACSSNEKSQTFVLMLSSNPVFVVEIVSGILPVVCFYLYIHTFKILFNTYLLLFIFLNISSHIVHVHAFSYCIFVVVLYAFVS